MDEAAKPSFGLFSLVGVISLSEEIGANAQASAHSVKYRVKSSMARSLPVENLLPQKVGSIINYLQ